MMTRLILVSAFAALCLPFAASAQDLKSEVRAACQSDVKANCGMVFSRDKALACLVQNAAKLSSGCTKELKVASCNDKAPANVKAAFPCAQ